MLVLDVASEMIIFDSSLESWVNKASKDHCKLEREKTIMSTTYFLLGSFCSDTDIHVAFHAKCPLPTTANDKEGDKLSKTMDAEWIADSAEKITRMLPGGVNVVGLCVYSNKKIFTELRPTLTRAAARIQRTNNSLTMLNLGSVHDNMVLVHVETPNGKPQGMLIDVVKRGPDAPTKVQFSQLEWISLVTNASTRITLNVPERKTPHFYDEFCAALKPFAENLFQTDLMLIDNALRSSNEPLFKDIKKKKAHSLDVKLFIDPCYNRENECLPDTATNVHEITFDIEIRASVPTRSKVEAAKWAVKQHLIRTLTARAELHYESMELVEEALEAPCTVHQMPRPATTLLPVQGTILISDYLFEADTIEDAQKNIKELIGLDPNIDTDENGASEGQKDAGADGTSANDGQQPQTSTQHVDDGWERALLPEEMACARSPLDQSPVPSLKPNEEDVPIWPFFVVLAVIIAVVAIIVYFTVDTSERPHHHAHSHSHEASVPGHEGHSHAHGHSHY